MKEMKKGADKYAETHGGAPSIDVIQFEFADYKEALEARKKFIREHEGRAIYMEHGGDYAFLGHSTAGSEAAEQLDEMGVPKTARAAIVVAPGAGGILGVIAGFRAYWGWDNSVGLAVQDTKHPAMINSLNKGKVVANPETVDPTITLDGRGYDFLDGIVSFLGAVTQSELHSGFLTQSCLLQAVDNP